MLRIPPARLWLEQPNPRTGELPSGKEGELAKLYENRLFSLMLSHALPILSRHAQYDDEGDVFLAIDVAHLPALLRRDMRLAGARVGVRFRPGRSRPRHVIDGDLSESWLERASVAVAEVAIERWNPEFGIALWVNAVYRARRPRNRQSKYTTADLLPGSRKAQVEGGLTESTVKRLRRQQRMEAGR
jgi:hypothetical protein